MLLLKFSWRLAATLLLASSPALAAETLTLLGAGAGVERAPYRGVDARTRLLPLLVYESRWLSVAGPGVDLKAYESGALHLRLRARYEFAGYEAKRSPSLAGMAERKSSPWLGAAMIWDSPAGRFSLEALGDVAGHSKGRQWQLEWERRFQLSERIDLTPRVNLRGLDRRYVDYYFGVRAAEARAGRPAYQGEATRQAGAGLRLGYTLDSEQLLFVDLSARQLGTAAANSPLVARRYEAGLFGGWLIRW